MSKVKYVDNLIIGAGLVGSITAYLLAQKNKKGILLERNADLGGVNGSFADPDGNWFDHGRHVINADRSDFTSDFFREVLNESGVCEFDLKRRIVIRGNLIPYASTPEEWPDDLRKNLKINLNAKAVHLGCIREEFAAAYGDWFADLVFDEMMSAYSILMWKLEHGVPEEQLLDWLFPWFFPRTSLEISPDDVNELGVYSDESRLYHYERRHSVPPKEPVLYPSGKGGYATWIHTMLKKAAEYIPVQKGLADLQVNINSETLEVDSVIAGNDKYVANNVFWCAPLPALCKLLDWDLPKGKPQWELLGSFTFHNPINADCHEILFADPAHRIRRINFPGLMSGTSANILQVEYTTIGDEVNREREEWKSDWLKSLTSIGILDAYIEPKYYDFKKISRGIISTENLSTFLEDCRNRVSNCNGNLIVPHMAVASDNNARLVPKVYEHIKNYINN